MKKRRLVASILTATKITIVQTALSLAFAASLYAHRAEGQDILDRQVSFSVKNTSISKIISIISKQTGSKFMFSPEGIRTDRKLDCQVTNKKLKDFFDEILKPLNIAYKVLDEGILLYSTGVPPPKTTSGENQDLTGQRPLEKTINGTVVNEKGQPVANATVMVKGGSTGTSTDQKGNFSISVPDESSILVISYVGFRTQELTVGNKATLQITLQSADSSMEDVIIVGYGQQKKRDLTGSVATISSKDFEKQPIIRVEDALKARAAGVQVQTPNGAPGAAVKIRVRGANSINGNNDPLYVIDGFIGGDITTLNPNDIASIDILKDASSTAIFGSRGANGVVIITTKKGTEGKPTIGFDAFYNFNTVTKKVDLLNGPEFMETVNAQNAALGLNPQFTDAQIAEVKNSGGGTDWQDEVLRTGATQNYQLSYSGGNEKTRVYLSGNYADQKGIIINSYFKRYGLRANINSTVSRKINFSFNFNGTFQKSRNNYNYNGRNTPYGQALVYPPNLPVMDSATDDYTKSPSYGPVADNPVFNAKEWNYDANASTILSSAQVNYEIIPGLTLSIGGGVTGYNNNNPYFKRNAPGSDISFTTAGYYNAFTWSYQNTNQLTYQKTFADIHKINITAIYEQQASTAKWNSAAATDFPTINLGYNNLSLGGTQNAGSGHSEWSLQSYLGRLNYSFMDKYLFTATMRADGSSKFQGKNKYGYFPSGAVAWRMSEESFIRDLNLFSELKLRASYGLTGSQAISPYQTLNLLATSVSSPHYPFNGQDLSIGIGPGAPGNPDLKWESTAQTDIGLDAGFFNGRLNITADYYHKKTTDLLLYVLIPDYAGGGSTLKNVGSMQNKGFEFLVNGIITDRPGLRISTSINASFFRNKVLNLGAEQEIFTDGGFTDIVSRMAPPFILGAGQPLGQFRGLIFEGLWQEKDAAEAALFGNKPGDSRYADLNGDHKIDGSDMTRTGSSLPKYTWGWNSTFEYGNFDLNIFINGVGGNDIWNIARWMPISQGGDVKNPTSVDIRRRWTPTNTNTDIPAFSSTNISHAQSSKFIENASFIRLNNLSLGYNLPRAVLNKVKIAQARVYVGAQNLFVITDYKGLDPELSTTPTYTDIAQGVDNLTYPAYRTYTVGIKVVF